MSTGSGGLGFGSGFAKGFANGLFRKHLEERDNQQRAEERQSRDTAQILPIILQNAMESGDFSNAEQFISAQMPSMAKFLKKQGGLTGTLESIAPLLKGQSHAAPAPTGLGQPTGIGQGQTPPDQAAMQGEQDSALTQAGQPPQTPVLPSHQTVTPQAPPKPPPTFFGTPVLTPEQRLARTSNAQIEAKIATAKRLRELDPSMSLEESLITVGLKVPQDQYGVVPSGGSIYKKSGDGAGTITEPGTAKLTNLPGALGERTREMLSLHPEMDEPTARAAAAKDLETERAAGQDSKLASAESLRANRAIQQTLLKMQEAQGGITPNNAAALTVQLRRDWTKATQPFKDRQTYVAKLNEMITPDANGKTGIQRDRNVATQTIINSFNRLLEEQNTVREGEYARSEELTPLTTWLNAKITSLQSGGGKLTDDQLKSIAQEGVRIANVTASVYEDGLKSLRTATERQLGRYNIPPEDVFGNSKLGATAPAAGGKPGAAPAAGPAGVTIKDGKLYQNGVLLPGQ